MKNVISFGGPGAGKSAFGNALLDDNPNGKRFNSQSAPDLTGVTQTVQKSKNNAFNDKNKIEVNFIDIPGVLDTSILLDDIVNQIEQQLAGSRVDAGIIILKATDNRFKLEEMLAIKVITNFFKKINPVCCWLCITHCDVMAPDQKFIDAKLANIQKFGLKIEQNHIIKFNIKNHHQSLDQFVQFLSNQNANDNMEFIDKSQMPQAINNIAKELPSILAQDKNWQQQIEMLKELQLDMRAQLEEQQKQNNNLSQQLIAALNRPPIIVKQGGGGGCQIF